MNELAIAAWPRDITGGLAGGSLRTCLQLAVPLWLETVRTSSLAELTAMATESARVLADEGPLPQPGGEPAGTARTVTHLARMIAIAALGPGGITFAGMHWCLSATR